MEHRKSQKLWKRALEVFPGGVNSPVRAFRSVGGEPVFIESGRGAYVYDTDGNKYLDFLSSWGPLILGHAPRKVTKAIRRAAVEGSTFGAVTEREVLLGEFILSQLRFVDKIRFVNSGTEAVMTALRLARGVTGRKMIIKFEGCYHGHSDSLLAKAGSGLLTLAGNIAEASSPGVPDEIVKNTLVLPLNDKAHFEDALKKHAMHTAAVIIEPVPANAGLLLQTRDFINYIVEASKAKGILVIFDEVISGFRLGFTGYAGREKLTPDIVTYGKIIGGGLPVGALAGKKQIMDQLSPQGAVYQAGTLSGNPLAMAAGLAALKQLTHENGAVYRKLKELSAYLQENFTEEIAPLFQERDWQIQLIQDESLFWFSFQKKGAPVIVRSVQDIEPFSAKIYAKIFHALLGKGIYIAPSAYEVGFLNNAMRRRDIDFFIKTLKIVIQSLPKEVQHFS
ncbi:MAG TPA: glutamate-1-semialdehyde 2,1-aminomutase [Turneriella sp.]|nr:glutamate-1-semialdehyde 2,1-aminomutase [Turneriella sp.]